MKVDLKFVENYRKVFRQFGATALPPAAIEALFAIAELSLTPAPAMEEVKPAPVLIGEDPMPRPPRKRAASQA